MDENKESNSPRKLYVIIFALIAVFFATAVWPVWNLIPEYVTEEVRVASNSEGKCYIHTDDNFLIPAGDACGNAKADDRIQIEYDVKIKDRMDAAVRHP
ncbi:hypothetical protein [Nitrosopumilus sp.]|uniref:hypothetical protein n=1 Tax=Nitrosopumilus sp. TaxID=2024843 RepID=UPI0034A0A220